MKTGQTVSRAGFSLALASVLAILTAAPSAFAAVGTDQQDYAPGSVVTIRGDNSNGAGYVTGNEVDVSATADNGLWADSCSATVQADGSWSCTVTLSSDPSVAVGSYTYTATSTDADGNPISESGVFTDAAIQTSVSLTSNHNPSTVGQSVTFTAAVTRDDTSAPVQSGQVAFGTGPNCEGDFHQIQAPQNVDTNGHVTYTTNSLAQGATTIRGCYLGFGSGSTGLQKSGTTLVQTVNSADITPPSVTSLGLSAGSDTGSSSSDRVTKATTLTYNLVFSEAVTGVAASDFSTNAGTGCTAGNVTGSGTTYTVDLTSCTEGTVTLTFAANGATDTASNTGPTSAYSAASVTVDRTAPTSSISFPVSGATYVPAGYIAGCATAAVDDVCGTASDNTGGSGLYRIEISIQRSSDLEYWDGSDWVALPTWVVAGSASPWTYGFVPGLDVYTLRTRATDVAGNVQGAAATATFTVVLAPPELIGLNSVSISATGVAVDSFSGLPYSSESEATVASNGTITLSGAQVLGTVTHGTVVLQKGASTLGVLDPAEAIPARITPACVAQPVDPKQSLTGKFSYDAAKHDLTVSGGNTATLTLSGSYCFHNITVSGGSKLVVPDGVSVDIVLTGQFNGSGGSLVNQSKDPLNLQISTNYTGSNGVTLSGGTNAYALVFAPFTSVTLSGGSPLFGAILGKTLVMSGSSVVHCDTDPDVLAAWAANFTF